MAYERILPVPDNFADAEATSVESLRDAWREQRGGLAEGGALADFNEKLVRRWSIETGIIERLYTLDRGTTELLITQGLNVALIEHGASDLPADELISILEDHRAAAGYVVDYVAQHRGLTGHFIKSIHSLLTRNQEFVDGEDQFGHLIRTALRKGEWKQIPNNPRRPSGSMHEYCPPALVEEEIENLLRMYEEMGKRHAPSIIKAAWLHHRFTQIHPFQDGNGRTARALTAMVLVSEDCFPIVVDRDIRDQYIGALEQADGGDLTPLVRLFSLLEKRELEQALSMSEQVLLKTPTSDGSLRIKLLAALRDRAREKRLSISAKRQEVIAKASRVFKKIIVPIVEKTSEELRKILQEELPGSDVYMEVSDKSKRHYFKIQIVQIAEREGYYGDFETAHEWVRLRLKRPGEADVADNEIVISMHSLGRHFTGVLVISAYFATRFLDESKHSVTLEPHRLAERSLTFSYLEDENNIADRVTEWTNGVLDVGIAQLQATL